MGVGGGEGGVARESSFTKAFRKSKAEFQVRLEVADNCTACGAGKHWCVQWACHQRSRPCSLFHHSLNKATIFHREATQMKTDSTTQVFELCCQCPKHLTPPPTYPPHPPPDSFVVRSNMKRTAPPTPASVLAVHWDCSLVMR